MSNRSRGSNLGGFTTRLSLAVGLVDAFTGRAPLGNPQVRIKDVDARPVSTPSGYHVFTDLEGGPVTVLVDGGERYFAEHREQVATIDLSDPDTDIDPSDRSTLPLVRIELTPSPSYRFPAGVTLIRGTVRDPEGNAVTGAHLSVRNRDISTRTDENGEFAIFFRVVTEADVRTPRRTSSGRLGRLRRTMRFFRGVTETDVRTADDRTLITVDGEDPTIEVTHTTLGETSDTFEVEEGKLTVHDINYP